jgi:hypothetical protein
MLAAIRFTDDWSSELNILHPHDDVLVDNVEFDYAAILDVDLLIGSDTDCSDDFLHSGKSAVTGGNTIVE